MKTLLIVIFSSWSTIALGQMIEHGDTIDIEYSFEYRCNNSRCQLFYQADFFDFKAGTASAFPLYYYDYNDFNNSGTCWGHPFIGHVECDTTFRYALLNDSKLYSISKGKYGDLNHADIDSLVFYYPGAGRSDFNSKAYYTLSKKDNKMALVFYDVTGQIIHEHLFTENNNTYRVIFKDEFFSPPYPQYHSLRVIRNNN